MFEMQNVTTGLGTGVGPLSDNELVIHDGDQLKFSVSGANPSKQVSFQIADAISGPWTEVQAMQALADGTATLYRQVEAPAVAKYNRAVSRTL